MLKEIHRLTVLNEPTAQEEARALEAFLLSKLASACMD